MTLQDWSDLLCDELDVELDLDITLILDLARDAAHAVERPAAPLTAFLVGYAAAVRGGGAEDVDSCAEVATLLIRRQASDGSDESLVDSLDDGPDDGPDDGMDEVIDEV